MENDPIDKTVKIIMTLFIIKQNKKLITKPTKKKYKRSREYYKNLSEDEKNK